MKWTDVEDVLDYSTYRQKRKEVPAERMAFLKEYLTLVTKMMGACDVNRKEAKCYPFIAPVLVCICDLLGDDVKILIEETIKGNEVHGNGFFEFVIQRGNKKFCIVEAKRDDFLQGATQALIGCEAVADREGLDTVYAIVTDFVKWHFYRSGPSKIEQATFASEVTDGVMTDESIKKVCESLYGFLAEETDY